MIYLLDEILEKIKKINKFEFAGQMAEEENEEQRNQIESQRGFISDFGHFAFSYLETISKISLFIKEAFLCEVLIDKLTAGTNYILYQLNSEKTMF